MREMELAVRQRSLNNKPLRVPYLILKFLSHEGQACLDATEFALLETDTRRCIRGTHSVSANIGTFRWNQSVRGICVLALRYFLYGDSDNVADRSISGGAGSLAASLDYSIAKNTGWLAEIFGSDTNGTLVIRKLITRQNPERKRPGPVVVAFTKKIIDMSFYLNGEQLVEKQSLERLLAMLERSDSGAIGGGESRIVQAESGNPGHGVQRNGALQCSCPYKGLQAFESADSSIYFGRENETEHLMEKILRVPFVAVVGPSGIGKSSMISAGLVPLLTTEDSLGAAGAVGWRWITFRPLVDPTQAMVESLINSLCGGPICAAGQEDVKVLAEELKIGNAIPVLKILRRTQKGAANLLIIVDEFEEIFTSCSEEARQAFYVAVQALVESDSLCRFVCTLRSDFFLEFLSSGLGHYLEKGMFPLHAMRRDQMKRAIESPAFKMGRRFQEGLVDTILDDAAEEPGALPLVQFVLERLWEMHQSPHGDITLGSYRLLGGLSGALASHADEVLAWLSPDDIHKARDLFCRLVRVAVSPHDVRGTRVSLPLSSEISSKFEKIISVLTESRLLVASRTPYSNTPSLELSHEAIIQHWATLRAWIAEDREFLLWRTRVSPLIAEAVKPGGEVQESFLLRGKALEEAGLWMETFGDRLSWIEREFIHQSVSANNREVADRRHAEIESAIMALRCVNFADLASALKVLHSAYPEALPRLVSSSDAEDNEDAQLRICVARLAFHDHSAQVVNFVTRRVLQLPIESFLAVVEILSPHRELITTTLWAVLRDQEVPEAQFVKAAALLSEFDPSSSNWSSVLHRLVQCISHESPTSIVPVGPLFRSIRERLIDPLVQICTSDSEGDSRRTSAALLMVIINYDDVPLLARLASIVGEGQYGIFVETLKVSVSSLDKARAWWKRRLCSSDEITSKERAGIAFNLCNMGSGSLGIPALFSVPSDLSPLAEFVALSVAHGVDHDQIWRSFIECSDQSALYVLLLTLGSSVKPPQQWIQDRLPALIEMYRHNPDAGIHGTIRRLFHIWDMNELRLKLDQELTGNPIDWSRGWFVLNAGGMPCTFATFTPPGGTVKDRFAMAVVPVTRREFSMFRSDSRIGEFEQYHPEETCPVVGVSWFDALEYCGWIQQNIPKNLGLQIRLPLDSEWELACRQNTTTEFFFGSDQQHLKYFGWYYANAVNRTRPVATLRPTPWGMFDMHGNVWEWMMDQYSQQGVKIVEGEGDSRLLRGGAWCDSPTWCRATQRSNPHWPSDRNLMFGFRISCVKEDVAP
jgi:hypothetical protein